MYVRAAVHGGDVDAVAWSTGTVAGSAIDSGVYVGATVLPDSGAEEDDSSVVCVKTGDEETASAIWTGGCSTGATMGGGGPDPIVQSVLNNSTNDIMIVDHKQACSAWRTDTPRPGLG